MKRLLIGCMAGLTAILSFVGCEQDKPLYEGPNYLMFSDTLYRYPVQENNEIFNVPVSATASAKYDRTFAVEIIDKKSNAVEGKHYKLLSNSVTIKAGELVGNVEVQGMYDNIGITDSLGFALRLIVPETEQWELYGTEAKVVLQKICPFDINNFSGWCLVTSTFLQSNYMGQIGRRLIKSSVAEDEENTVVLHGLYLDGYDTKISFDRTNLLEPLIEMDKQVCGTTGEIFGTIVGNGDFQILQSANYISYYNTCQKYIFQYVTLGADMKDGSFNALGTYINLVEWISEAEAEKLKEQGY